MSSTGRSAGVVYALGNPTYATVDSHGMPSFLYKVGVTTLDPFERARQLTAATASPTAFQVVHYRRSDDIYADEARCHELLDQYRVNEGREFFKAPLAQVIAVIDEVTGASRASAAGLYPWAVLFASFDQDGPEELTEDEQARCRALERELADKERKAA